MMRAREQRRLVLGAAGAVVVGAVGVSAAYASIPDQGVYTGCYNVRTGALRVVDPAKQQCNTTSEKQITWNQQGPPGPPGETGAAGPAGADALAQVSYAKGSPVDVPPGAWIQFDAKCDGLNEVAISGGVRGAMATGWRLVYTSPGYNTVRDWHFGGVNTGDTTATVTPYATCVPGAASLAPHE